MPQFCAAVNCTKKSSKSVNLSFLSISERRGQVTVNSLIYWFIQQKTRSPWHIKTSQKPKKEATTVNYAISKEVGLRCGGILKGFCIIQSWSNVGTLVSECYEDDYKSQWENLKFDPDHKKCLNRSSSNFAWVTMSKSPTATLNFITICSGVWCASVQESFVNKNLR